MIHKILVSEINQAQVFIFTSVVSMPKGELYEILYYQRSESFIEILKNDTI